MKNFSTLVPFVIALAAAPLHASSISLNTGSLGAAANGTDAAGVTFSPGPLASGGDQAAFYSGAGISTIVPFNSGVNPSSSSPFSIEFWAYPTAWDNDDSPISNRISSGSRSGWAFFQRGSATGWNLRMYNGTGSDVGWDLTGGTSNLFEWSHVVATWSGTAAKLYVNGVLVDDVNDTNKTPGYNASTAANLVVGATDNGSPYNGGIDEVALYGSELTPAQIASHFAAAPGSAAAYQALVRSNGARLQLSNVPEPTAAALLGLGALTLTRRRRA
jgi:hypothetical protein